MNKVMKKEMRQSIELAVNETLTKYKISRLSKKSEKLLTNFSKKFAGEIKKLLKKKSAPANKVQKPAPKKVRKQAKKKIDS